MSVLSPHIWPRTGRRTLQVVSRQGWKFFVVSASASLFFLLIKLVFGLVNTCVFFFPTPQKNRDRRIYFLPLGLGLTLVFAGVVFAGVAFADVVFAGVAFADVVFAGVAFAVVAFDGVAFGSVAELLDMMLDARDGDAEAFLLPPLDLTLSRALFCRVQSQLLGTCAGAT